MKKIVILIIVGIVLVLSATFLYINIETISNDMVISKARKVASEVASEVNKNGSIPLEQEDAGAGTASDMVSTGVQDEASLDTVFDVEESADNFDDIVM